MNKSLHIKLLLLFSLSILFGHSAFGQTNTGGSEDVCAGELRSYRVVGSENSTIHWTLSGGGEIVENTSLAYSEKTIYNSTRKVFESIIQVQWGTTSGSFQLTAYEKSIGGCSSGDLVLKVKVNSLPSGTLSSSDADNVICLGDNVTFTATGGTNYDFKLDGASVQKGTSDTYSTSTLSDGQKITVEVTNKNSCIATYAGITTTVNALPAKPSITGSLNVCKNATIQLSTTMTTTETGVWNSSDPSVATIDSNSGLVKGIASGSTDITCVVSNGSCDSDKETVSVRVHERPELPKITIDEIACHGGKGSVTADFSSSTIPNGLVLQIRLIKEEDKAEVEEWTNVSPESTYEFSSLPALKYRILIRYTDGVKRLEKSTRGMNIELSEPELIVLSSASVTSPILCNGNNAEVTLVATGGTGAYTYSSDGATYQVPNVFSLPAEAYTLYVKDENGCVSQKNIEITEPDAIKTDLKITSSDICFGDAGIITIENYETDVGYSLFEGVNSLAYTSSESGSNLILTIEPSVLNTEKTYNITIRAVKGGCTLDMGTVVHLTVEHKPNPGPINY